MTTDILISKITVISHPVYGHTFEVNYSDNLTSDIYTDNTVPAIVKALVETSDPDEQTVRPSYTIKVYNK